MKTQSENAAPELLDLDKIKPYLSEPYARYRDKMMLFQRLPSTQAFMLQQEKAKKSDVAICFAEEQTQGRGRLGRGWYSPWARNIYVSLSLEYRGDAQQLSGLSLVMAIAVVKAVKRAGVQELVNIKWPNDVLFQGKKLAGILVDVLEKSPQCYQVVVGIGLNVNMMGHHNFLNDEEYKTLNSIIGQEWIDMASILPSIPDRNQLAGLLLDEVLIVYSIFQACGFIFFQNEWKEYDVADGQKVKIITARGKTYEGIGRGVNEKGHFLLETEGSRISIFLVGDVSLQVTIHPQRECR